MTIANILIGLTLMIAPGIFVFRKLGKMRAEEEEGNERLLVLVFLPIIPGLCVMLSPVETFSTAMLAYTSIPCLI